LKSILKLLNIEIGSMRSIYVYIGYIVCSPPGLENKVTLKLFSKLLHPGVIFVIEERTNTSQIPTHGFLQKWKGKTGKRSLVCKI
jgi:hypothetical protein